MGTSPQLLPAAVGCPLCSHSGFPDILGSRSSPTPDLWGAGRASVTEGTRQLAGGAIGKALVSGCRGPCGVPTVLCQLSRILECTVPPPLSSWSVHSPVSGLISCHVCPHSPCPSLTSLSIFLYQVCSVLQLLFPLPGTLFHHPPLRLPPSLPPGFSELSYYLRRLTSADTEARGD